jgi:signal transduction histidine kinase
MPTRRNLAHRASQRPVLAGLWAWLLGVVCLLAWVLVALEGFQPTVSLTRQAAGWQSPAAPGLLFTQIRIDGATQAVKREWLAASPGHLRTAAELHEFYLGESAMFRAAQLGKAQLLTDSGEALDLHFAARQLSDLGAVFWVALFAGFAVYLLAALLIHLTGFTGMTRLYGLASFGYFMAIAAHGLHSDRAWGLSALVWQVLVVLIVSGSVLSVWAIVALLWRTPMRLGSSRGLTWGLFAVVALDIGLCQWQGTAAPHRWLLGLGIACLAVLFLRQWWLAKTQRRLLSLLSIRMVLLISLPCLLLTGLIWFAFVLGSSAAKWNNLAVTAFALCLISISALVIRRQLYLIGHWFQQIWLTVLTLVVAMVLLVLGAAFDQISSSQQVVIAVLLSILFAVFVSRRLRANTLRNKQQTVQTQWATVLAISQAPAAKRAALWQALLQDYFLAQAHTTLSERSPAVSLLAYGSVLKVAGQAGVLPTVYLSDAHRGQRLFTADDAADARLLRDLLLQGIQSHAAYRRGADEARRDIAADLHDDLGGRLLSLSQRLSLPAEAALARDLLADLRNLSHALASEANHWEDSLADLRWDLGQRAAHAGLVWQWVNDLSPTVLRAKPATAAALSLSALLSELLRNTVQHSGSRFFAVHWADDGQAVCLTVRFEAAQSPATWRLGFGLTTINKRVQDLAGESAWLPRDAAGCVGFVATIPLTRFIDSEENPLVDTKHLDH